MDQIKFKKKLKIFVLLPLILFVVSSCDRKSGWLFLNQLKPPVTSETSETSGQYEVSSLFSRGVSRIGVAYFKPERRYNLLQVTRAQRRITAVAAKSAKEGGSLSSVERLTDDVHDAMMAETLQFPKPVWSLAVQQYLMMNPKIKVQDPEGVLERVKKQVSDDISVSDGNQDLRKKILTSLTKITDADGKNILSDRSEVLYIAANRMLAKTQSIPTAVHDLKVEISPKDLVKAYQFFCDESLCQASLITPAKVDFKLPIGLNAHVDLVFARSFDTKKGDVVYDINVDGVCKTFTIGKLLAVDISMGVNMQYYRKDQKITLSNPRCSIGVSCDTPIVNVSGRVGSQGISFDSSVDYPDVIPDWMVKMLPQEGEVHASIPLDQIDSHLVGLLRQVKNLPPLPENADITWNDLIKEISQDTKNP